jgi:hypothetical protein
MTPERSQDELKPEIIYGNSSVQPQKEKPFIPRLNMDFHKNSSKYQE